MRNKPTITVVIGDGKLFSGYVPDDVDRSKSAKQYVREVYARLKDEYSGADVRVFYDPGCTREVSVHGFEFSEISSIQFVLDDVYVQMNWLAIR